MLVGVEWNNEVVIQRHLLSQVLLLVCLFTELFFFSAIFVYPGSSFSVFRSPCLPAPVLLFLFSGWPLFFILRQVCTLENQHFFSCCCRPCFCFWLWPCHPLTPLCHKYIDIHVFFYIHILYIILYLYLAFLFTFINIFLLIILHIYTLYSL